MEDLRISCRRRSGRRGRGRGGVSIVRSLRPLERLLCVSEDALFLVVVVLT
jgi:hypothetical protein